MFNCFYFQIRSPKNVHFAASHEENIVMDPLDDEIGALPPSIRWEEDQTTTTTPEIASRSPRVNFDLDSSVSVLPDSTTHTDTEGSDCGNGGSDSSAGIDRKSSRRRQHSTQNNQIPSKKKSIPEVNSTNPSSSFSSSSSSSTTTTTSVPPLPTPAQLSPQPAGIQSTIPMTPNSESESYTTPHHPQPTQYPVPPTPYPHHHHHHTTTQFNPSIHSPLPFPPLFGGHSNLHSTTQHHQQPQPAAQQPIYHQQQPTQVHPQTQQQQAASFGMNPEMESLLTDMLMAWYQSGYTTGRYYTLLEQQQQTMQQWYTYYQTNANNQNNQNYNQNGNNS